MLKLNADSVALYNSLRADILEDWKSITTSEGCVKLYQNVRDRIAALDSSNDEPDEGEIDAGHAAVLHQLNVQQQRDKFAIIKSRLATSHDTDTIESSNTANTTEVITVSNATIDISTLNLNELATLQLQIAQRIQEIVSSQSDATVSTDEPTEYSVEVIEATTVPVIEEKPKASRVRKPKAEKVTTNKTSEPAPKVEAIPATPAAKAFIPNMKYADLRSFISKATKSSSTAKEHAQSIARKYGAKSWATVGRQGYEEIYSLIK